MATNNYTLENIREVIAGSIDDLEQQALFYIVFESVYNNTSQFKLFEKEITLDDIKKIIIELSVPKKQKVTLGDLTQQSSNKSLYRKLSSFFTGEQVLQYTDHSRIFGVRSHVAIPFYFDRTIIEETPQLSLFEKTLPVTSFDTLKKDYADVVKKIKKEKDLEKGVFFDTEQFSRVEGVVAKIFNGEYVKLRAIIEKDSSEIKKYFFNLTILTWANIVLQYPMKLERKILFRELSVFSQNADLSLGRIDALEVIRIDGKRPTQRQKKVLRSLTKRKYSSVGKLLITLEETFQKNMEIVIHDWKFSVGDGVGGIGKKLNVIISNSVKKNPITKHTDQMRRYLSLVPVAYAFEKKGIQHSSFNSNFLFAGKIHYFFPTHRSIVCEIQHGEEKSRFFLEQVLEGYIQAHKKRVCLVLEKTVLGVLIHSIKQGRVPILPFEMREHNGASTIDFIQNIIKNGGE